MTRIRACSVTAIAAMAAAVAVVLPSSAIASFDPEFSVVSKDVRYHEIPDGFAGRTVLLNPANLDNRVGYGKVRCVFIEETRKARCRVLFHLDGTIGGFGDLLIKGNNGGRDSTMNVVDGNGDFTGAVTGKVFIHHISRPTNLIDFSLTR